MKAITVRLDSGGLDVHLMAGSPCIDAGNPAAPPDPDGTVADAGARPFDADHCGTPRALCTPKVNSRGCIPEIGFEGAPVLGAQGELDFVVSASNVLNNQIGILVWSPTPAAVPFLGGVRCVGTPFVRSPVLATGGNPPPLDCSGRLRFRFTAEYVADAGLRPFETVYAQFWYRDPGFAPPEDVGLTDALRFVLCP